MNADPLGENGGFNLHAFCGNDGANRIDPWGMDFIALAERPLKSVPDWAGEVRGQAQHSSIEYWESDCPAGRNVEWNKQEFLGASTEWHVQWLDSTELDTDERPWRIWERGRTGYPGAPMAWYLVSKQSKVSYIKYHQTEGRRFSAFYEPPWTWSAKDATAKAAHKAAVKRMWDRIFQLSQRYRYAEREGFSVFQNWPNSHFFVLGNNCHVFAGWVIRRSGNIRPTISGRLWNIDQDPSHVHDIWAGRWPFLGNQPPPPKN